MTTPEIESSVVQCLTELKLHPTGNYKYGIINNILKADKDNKQLITYYNMLQNPGLSPDVLDI